MRILFLCGREPDYPRNQFLIYALRQLGHVDVLVEKGGPSLANLRRSLMVSIALLPRLLFYRYDLVVVGFWGHLLMLPAGFFKRQPVLFDSFVSTYDTLVEDRKQFNPNSLPARMAVWLDRTSCGLADRVLLDTRAQMDYFTQSFGVPPDKLDRLWVGSDEHLFYPRPVDYDLHQVLFIGSFVPLQGVDVILRSAELLDRTDPNIQFRLIGRGIQYPQAVQFVQQRGLRNVQFENQVPLNELPAQIARVAICLGGHFGTSAKAARVIAGKTFHSMAMGKTTIVGENPANHELLTHDQDAWFCPMANPEALAESIRLLVQDPTRCARIGLNARATFLEQASLQQISVRVAGIVNSMVLKGD